MSILGVLMWEIFTCGKMPYGKLKNAEVVNKVVHKGEILEQPRVCPNPVYEVMRLCWTKKPEDRPPFRDLKERLSEVLTKLQDGD